MYKTIYLFLFLFLFVIQISASKHPHLIVNNEDKSKILSKIETEEWAKQIFSSMKQRLYPYVSHYRMTTEYDPTWLTSRYMMNREKGHHFTNLKIQSTGFSVDSIWGNAPVPTVRYSICEPRHETREIFPLILPSIDDLVPYNVNSKIPFFNLKTRKYEQIEPSRFCDLINGEINQIALDAAILYWLTDEKDYARLAADILQQWAKATYHQNSISGNKLAGFFSNRIGGDNEYTSLILVYDFLGNFLEENGYDTSIYQNVFEKLTNTLLSRGDLESFATKSPMLVFSALSIENKKKREKFLEYIIDRDSIISRDYGNLSLRSGVNRYFSSDGFYKDPSKSSNAVFNLMLSALALEKNNYNVLDAYPQILKAGVLSLYSVFPDLSLPSFGDNGDLHPEGELLDLSLTLSSMKKKESTYDRRALLDLFVRKGKYVRENSKWIGLLLFSSGLDRTEMPNDFWSRSGSIDYARYYYQRNDMDKYTGLMFGVQGATYPGNHANGMSADFYGAGQMMGIDPGIGRNQTDSLHINYYSQWAAHNTVIAAGSSSPERIYKGGGRAKAIGQIDLVGMEPMPNQEEISSNQSFVHTKYLEPFTRTNQERTIALIRTSPVSGFYVDIFRSNNKLWNDYLYHNIGDKMELLSEDRKPLPLVEDKIPMVEPDFPGLRFIKNTKSTREYKDGVISLFSLKNSKKESAYMQVLMPESKDRTYFTGLSPMAESAIAPYDSLPLPTLLVHHVGDAFKVPFVSVLEPYIGKDNNTVLSVNWLNRIYKGTQTALKIVCKDSQTYWVISSTEPSRKGNLPDGSFTGTYASIEHRQDTLHAVYLGKGLELECKNFSIRGKTADCSANVLFGDHCLDITTNQPVEISWDKCKGKSAILIEKGTDEIKPLERTRHGNKILVPIVKEARICFQ